MKKLLLTLFVLIFGLAAYAKPNYSYTLSPAPSSAYSGTYVNEEITTPISQIGVSSSFFEQDEVEKGLEIAWNQWHANVRNKVLSTSRIPKRSVVYLFYNVDKYKNISDIVIVYAQEKCFIKGDTAYLKANSPFYAYVQGSHKYYKLTLPQQSKTGTSSMTSALKNAQATEVSLYSIPDFTYFAQITTTLRKLNLDKVLTYPVGSKRSIVKVSQGITNIDWIKGKDKYKASEFNDIERQ